MIRRPLPRLTTSVLALVLIAVATSPATADYVSTVLADNPISYWRLGEATGTTATDAVGGTDLQYVLFPEADLAQAGAILGDGNTAVHFTPNPPNAALGDPSTHPTLVSSDVADFGFAAGQSFSLEYWIKTAPGNTSTNGAGIITKGYDSAQALPWYLTRYTGGSVDIYLRDASSNNSNAVASTSVTDNQWHHVVGVYDSAQAELQIFVDGIQEGAVGGVPAGDYGVNAQPFTIGNHYNRAFDGWLDEVAVYDSALGVVDVANHYFVGSGNSPAAALDIDFGNSAGSGGGPGGSLPGFYPFEASEGDTTDDVTRTFPTALGTADAVDVTIGGYTHFRDYSGLTDGSDAISPLLSDMALRNSDGSLRLELENLKPGDYEITTYHHSTQYGGGALDINLTDANGAAAVAAGLGISDGTAPPSGTSATFAFASDGSPVSIEFLGGSDADHLSLNGFSLRDAPTGPAPLGVVLAVDFNDRGATEATDPTVTAAGFSEFLLGGAENDDQTDATTHSFGGIDVTVSHSNGLGVGDRRRTLPLNGALYSDSELHRDVLFARTTSGGATTDDGLDVLVENLDPNAPYEVEIWSYDDGSNSNRVSDWSANGALAVEGYAFNGGNTNPLQGLPFDDTARFSFLATADADGKVLIEARQAIAGGEIGVFLNAMRVTAVVPEPGTLALLALGVVTLLLWRRQS